MSDELKVHTAQGMEFALQVAGIGSRSHAFVIDWHIRLILALGWLAVSMLLLGTDSVKTLFQSGSSGATSTFFFIAAPMAALYFLYHPLLEIAMHGRTPGKRMAGIRIVTCAGQTPKTTALLIRNIFRLVDSLPAFYVMGFAIALFTKQQVRIGDLAAGTVLVHEPQVSPATLEHVSRLVRDSKLTPEDQELLLELLERWKDLNFESRIRLGSKLIQKIGEAIPEAPTRKDRAKALHQRLSKLAKQE